MRSFIFLCCLGIITSLNYSFAKTGSSVPIMEFLDVSNTVLTKVQTERLKNILSDPFIESHWFIPVVNTSGLYKRDIINFSLPEAPSDTLSFSVNYRYHKNLIDKPGATSFYVSGNLITAVGDFVGPQSDPDPSLTNACRNGEISLSFTGPEMYTQIRVNRTNYILTSLGEGLHLLIRLTKKIPKSLGCSSTGISSQTLGVTNPQTAKKPAKSLASSEVKLLVLWNQSYENYVGGVVNVINEINFQVASTRQSYVDSGINTSELDLNLVGPDKIAFENPNVANNGQGIIVEDIEELILDNEAVQKRQQYEADLVVLLSGVDYGGNKGEAGTLELEKERAFAIVSFKYISEGITNLFAHELNHLFGCRHIYDQDKDCTPEKLYEVEEEDQDRECFNHGFREDIYRCGQILDVGTIMSLKFESVALFSSPDINYAGVALGTEERENNVRLIKEATSCVAQFYEELNSFKTENVVNFQHDPYSIYNKLYIYHLSGLLIQTAFNSNIVNSLERYPPGIYLIEGFSQDLTRNIFKYVKK